MPINLKKEPLRAQPFKTDWNICEHCNLFVPLDQIQCPNCEHSLVGDATGKIAIWRLGEIRDGILGHLVKGLSDILGWKAVIQPTFIDERLSERPNWQGRSSTVFLNQVRRRHVPGCRTNLGITESNIVPDARHHFLFGYAYLSDPAAVVSLEPLGADQPHDSLLVERLLKIAVHEIGHNLGLDHHAYKEATDCVMVGDDQVDSLAHIDSGGFYFCDKCRHELAILGH